MNLEQRIQALDDRDAVRILTSFAQHQSDYHDQGMTPDWTQALVNETGVSSIGPVSEGLLARAALRVLADDPQHCEVLEALMSSPAPERYSGVIETAAVLSAVLFVLGTHVKLERDKAGRWPELGGDVNFLMWAVPLVLLFLSLYFGSLLARTSFMSNWPRKPSRQAACSRNKLSGRRPGWPNSNRAGRRKQGSSRFACNWTGFLGTA